MAGSLSDYAEKKVLDLLFGNTAFSLAGPLYLALLTDSNTQAQRDAGTVTEVAGGSYARVSITQNTTNWPNASGTTATKASGAAFTFPSPTGNWGTVTAWAIYDASSGGNLIIHGDLASSRSILSGDGAPSFASGQLSITCD